MYPDHTASVLTLLDGDESPEDAPSFPLAQPFDGEALEDLRCYLEDYLLLPSGVYGERGPQIAECLPRWAEAMFTGLGQLSQHVRGRADHGRVEHLRTRVVVVPD
jgi:hypothetical protein